ncbi:MAG: hypothetical protein ACFN4H_03805 [Prevotella sp.]|jgi:hypothetical protein
MIRTRKTKRIVVLPSLRRALMAEFGASYSAVFLALNYSTNSERARDIREAAVKRYGGKEITEEKIIAL